MLEDPNQNAVDETALESLDDGAGLREFGGLPCGEPVSCGDLFQEGRTSVQLLPIDRLSLLLVDALAINGSNGSSVQHPLFNFSSDELLDVLAGEQDGYLDPVTQVVFIVCYASLMVLGVSGNLMVGWIIWRKKTMRTPRNLYIINLTVSDLSMCLVCMPITLVGLLYKNWGMGDLLCKLVPVLQGANILVSTSTVLAIAVDRYATIVKVGRSSRSKVHVTSSIAAIWTSSVLFTMPLYFYHSVTQVKLGHIVLYKRCIFQWPSRAARNTWLILLLMTQYGIPILVLSVVHARIKQYLGHHLMGQYDARRAEREIERNRKTTILLSTIAVAFAVCWLPWHVVNLLADFEYEGLREPTHFYAVFGASHIMAMSSASINPVLYGWLNTNLRRELVEVLPPIFVKLGCLVTGVQGRGRSMGGGGPGDSPTRQPESVTLLVFQTHPPTSLTQMVARSPHPPTATTTTTTSTTTTTTTATNTTTATTTAHNVNWERHVARHQLGGRKRESEDYRLRGERKRKRKRRERWRNAWRWPERRR
ncbi:LOW QUALITY PROTEIN: neuropeptide Y receptor type 2-like [Scylla paramamosain]|uniref:LOW QUALITY PROTEIN: neuropeptide Y receptor type 2-like n=1 Tax=Scylla paramamosain TaxID=85552 RepID=UPI003082F587